MNRLRLAAGTALTEARQPAGNDCAIQTRRVNMNDQNRVLLRQNARELNEQETAQVGGGIHTLTACTFNFAGGADGDTTECGGIW
jgi:hypothetical protein